MMLAVPSSWRAAEMLLAVQKSVKFVVESHMPKVGERQDQHYLKMMCFGMLLKEFVKVEMMMSKRRMMCCDMC